MPCLNGECPKVLWTVKPATKAEDTISQQKGDPFLGHTVYFQGDQNHPLSQGKSSMIYHLNAENKNTI